MPTTLAVTRGRDPAARSRGRVHAEAVPFALVADPEKLAFPRGRPLPPIFPRGGRYGLPAEFLIAPDGRVIACKYGTHVDDE